MFRGSLSDGIWYMYSGKFHSSMSVKIFWKRKVLFGNETVFEGWLDGRSALWLRTRMQYFFKVLLLSVFSWLEIWIHTPYIAYSGNSILLYLYFYSCVMTTDRCWVELPQTRSRKRTQSFRSASCTPSFWIHFFGAHFISSQPPPCKVPPSEINPQ